MYSISMLNNKQMSNWVGGLSTCHMCVVYIFMILFIVSEIFNYMMLYCTIFSSVLLFSFFLVDISITLFYFIFHYIMNHILLCHIRLCHILLCHILLHHIPLYHIVLDCIVFLCIVSFSIYLILLYRTVIIFPYYMICNYLRYTISDDFKAQARQWACWQKPTRISWNVQKGKEPGTLPTPTRFFFLASYACEKHRWKKSGGSDCHAT